MWQWFSNTSYRLTARAAAHVLGRHEIVRGVYARRSVAVGEVAWARSDIDLTIVLHGAADTQEEAEQVIALAGTFTRLRRLLPMLGEAFVFSPDELERAYRADSFRASLDRRSALWLYGEPVEIPRIPITQAGAMYRVVCWFDSYLARALRQGNQRNLRKFAIEIWNAVATLTGVIEKPFLTRRETEQAMRRHEPGLDLRRASNAELFALCCRFAGRAHAAVLAPLPPIDGRKSLDTGTRGVVVVPSEDPIVPAHELEPGMIIATPEVLELMIRYYSGSLYDSLEPGPAELGIGPPRPEDWMNTLRLILDPFRVRVPGFLKPASMALGNPKVLKRAAEVLDHLERGEVPPGKPRAKPARRAPPAEVDVRQYYREQYPDTCRRFRLLWERFEALERRTPLALPN